MSVKKDASGRRQVQDEVEVPGTPDEVWRAIATGPGISSWFVPTRSEERAGGQVVSNFGPGMDCPSTITLWEAPKRFVAEGTMGLPGSPTVATEWSVEARAGGKCVVREVGQLLRKSEELNKRLATLSIDTEVRFRSAEDRAAFSAELTAAVAALVSRYHDESASGGRRHRLIIGAYPTPGQTKEKETT